MVVFMPSVHNTKLDELLLYVFFTFVPGVVTMSNRINATGTNPMFEGQVDVSVAMFGLKKLKHEFGFIIVVENLYRGIYRPASASRQAMM